MARNTTLLVIKTAEGKIVGAVAEEKSLSNDVNIAVSLMPGQQFFKVTIPEELLLLKSSQDFQMAVSHLLASSTPLKLNTQKIIVRQKGKGQSKTKK